MGLDDGDARQLERDVVRVEQDRENEMIVVDEIAKKGFVSVDNIWVVDRLRERVAEEQKKLRKSWTFHRHPAPAPEHAGSGAGSKEPGREPSPGDDRHGKIYP